MKIFNNIINLGMVAINAFFINQLVWIVFIYTLGFIFIQWSGIPLVELASANPWAIIFWNFFNDLVPYIITSYRQNFNFNLKLSNKFIIGLFFGYSILGLLVAWRWSGNPFLRGINYPLFTFFIFLMRTLFVINLISKAYVFDALEN